MADIQLTFADNDYCFACGSKNPIGMQLTFYADSDTLCTRVLPKPHWQGWNGVVHGGILSTIFDDLMSNHLFRLEQTHAVTAELTARFKKPVPIDSELLFASTVAQHSRGMWVLKGECTVIGKPDTPLAVASGKFIEVHRA